MWEWIARIGTIFTIGGVSIANFIASETKAWIALAIFTLTCLWGLRVVYRATRRYLKQHYPRGIMTCSTFARWSTVDGQHYVYDVYRTVQIKKPFMRHHEHRFNWTGTKAPVITSDLQTVLPLPEENGMNGVKLVFPNTRAFNETEVLHCKMVIDDSDHVGSPFLSQVVHDAVRLISFRVELAHATPKYHRECARLSRLPIDAAPNVRPESLGTAPFDAHTKSFTWNVPNPEPGYRYRIEWDKPTTRPNGNGRGKPASAKPAGKRG